MVVLCGYEAVREALVGTRPKLVIRPFNAIFQLIHKGRGRCVVQQGLRQVGRRSHQLCFWGLLGTGSPWALEGARGEGPALLSAGQSGSWGGTGCPRGRRRGGTRGGHTRKGGGPATASSLGSRLGAGGRPALPRPPPVSCSPADWPAGILSVSGPPWKASHQFTVRALHDLGVGRRPVADKVLQELSYLLGQLDHYGGEWRSGALLLGPRPLRLSPPGRPFPVALLGWATSNITLTVLFGQRFDYKDPVFVALLELMGEVMLHLATFRVQVREVAAPRPRGGAGS